MRRQITLKTNEKLSGILERHRRKLRDTNVLGELVPVSLLGIREHPCPSVEELKKPEPCESPPQNIPDSRAHAAANN